MNKEVLKQLNELVEKHPDYEIVVMVDGEIVPEDSCFWWEASLGKVEIGTIEYINGIKVPVGEESCEDFELNTQKHVFNPCINLYIGLPE